ncbi:MAG: ABC transporter permease [Bdellovibrionaceae bacterium]|nr:ABC transporter permease [Pseudobdellovibrionaceae bacterium]
MTNFIIRRLIQTVIVIALLSYFCFYLMTLMPGDPVDLMIQSNPRITSEDVARLRNLYGLDQPTYVRYWNWMSGILQGDLGYSRTYRIPVSDIMGPKLVNTFVLSFASLALALIIAIPLGVWSALRAGTKTDYVIGFFAFSGVSMPSFWLGLILIIAFAVWIPWFPAGGTETIGVDHGSWWSIVTDRAYYLVLPTVTLAYISIGRFLRFTRSAMLEAMRNDYIRTARAKGLSRVVVIWQHGFRNALLSLITMVTLSFSGVFSGATITETVFAYQGVGKLVYDSIIANDFNVAMISFMISVSMVLIFNLIADIMYSFADPRISLS